MSSKNHAPNLTLVKPLADNARAQAGPSDDSLMTRAAAGDTAAYASLVERYQPSVRRFCGCIVADDDVARDVSQDVFLKVWSVRERYTPNGRFKAFLFTVARNMSRSANRKRRLRSALGLESRANSAPSADDETPTRQYRDESPDPSQQLENAQDRALVFAALQRLEDKYRIPLMMRFVEELPYEDIAAVIGRTESTARSRVHYGLKRLATLLPTELERPKRGGR